MKYILLSFFVLVAFSCTKTKTVTVTKNDTITVVKNDTTNDTTKIYYQPSLIGSWSDGTYPAHLQPTFTIHTLQWSYNSPYNYVASGDSIYVLGLNSMVLEEYSYKISKTNDTLFLTSTLVAGSPTTVYSRVN